MTDPLVTGACADCYRPLRQRERERQKRRRRSRAAVAADASARCLCATRRLQRAASNDRVGTNIKIPFAEGSPSATRYA